MQGDRKSTEAGDSLWRLAFIRIRVIKLKWSVSLNNSEFSESRFFFVLYSPTVTKLCLYLSTLAKLVFSDN